MVGRLRSRHMTRSSQPRSEKYNNLLVRGSRNEIDVNAKGRKPLRPWLVHCDIRAVTVVFLSFALLLRYHFAAPALKRTCFRRTIHVERPDCVGGLDIPVNINRFDDKYGRRSMSTSTSIAFEGQIQLDSNTIVMPSGSDEEDVSSHMNEYFAFDDDDIRNTPFRNINKHCRRVSWHRLYHPNCNSFHETEFMNGKCKLLGEGAFRAAYLVREASNPNFVIKVNRFQQRDFDHHTYENVRMDALVMERLTSSPRIADIYGHCGTSVHSELLPTEAESMFIPRDGNGDNVRDENDIDPQNYFTLSKKLDHILEIAEALGDLHGFMGGVIVHDDIKLGQFLFTSSGHLKLNDFNRAEVMLFDEEDGSYCKYQNGRGHGRHRSPEEYKNRRLDEKIDVWSLGNSIYEILTGLSVFYHVSSRKKIREYIENGETAYLDPRYRNRNYIQDQLIKVLEHCWAYNPSDRADVFEVIQLLRETKSEGRRLGLYNETKHV